VRSILSFVVGQTIIHSEYRVVTRVFPRRLLS